MNVSRRDFLLLATLAAATLAAGQDVAPAIGQARSSVVQGAASIPDFSGIWAHMTWLDFEPPLTGPGPVTNRSRRNGVSDAYELIGDYTNPILKPHAAEIVKNHGEISLTGVPYPTPSNRCWPGGMPFVLYNIGMQMLKDRRGVAAVAVATASLRHSHCDESAPVFMFRPTLCASRR